MDKEPVIGPNNNTVKTFFIGFRAMIYMIVFVYVWAVVALSIRRFDMTIGILFPDWLVPVGIVLMAGGGILGLKRPPFADGFRNSLNRGCNSPNGVFV